MTWARRLIAFATGGAADEVGEELAALREGFRLRAQCLQSAAERAPHAGAEEHLRQLADEEAALGDRLEDVLGRRDGGRVETTGEPQAGGEGRNHWARLVRNLELHRTGRDRLLEAATQIPDREPDLAPLLDELARTEEAHVTRLRALIALADPQALD